MLDIYPIEDNIIEDKEEILYIDYSESEEETTEEEIRISQESTESSSQENEEDE